ncbi:MAG: hypothetical protein HY720_02870 [Planctomycetes bacterium]|nr:hypothetical protein [Planctomycetota bacterium]
MRASRILLLALLSAGGAAADERPVRYVAGVGFHDVLEWDAATWPPREIEMSQDRDWIAANLARWFARARARGADVIGLEPFDRDGVTYMSSEALRRAGFRLPAVGDLFDLACAEAKRQDLAITAAIEDLAHIVYRSKEFDRRIRPKLLGPEAVAAVVADLGGYAKRHEIEMWVDEEAYGEEYLEAIAPVARAQGLVYLHYFHDPAGRADLCLSEDYSTYPFDLARDEEERRNWRPIASWGGSTLGLGAIVFAHQAVQGKPAGLATSGNWGLAPGCERNVALLRAVQFAPHVYSFIPGWLEETPEANDADSAYCRDFDYGKDLAPLVERYARRPSETKPVANLVLCPPPPGKDSEAADLHDIALASSIDMIANAIHAAGYDLVATFGAPGERPADLYYVFATGRCAELEVDEDVPEAVAALVERASRVVVQAAGAPGTGPGWKRVLAALGLPTAVEEDSFSWDKPRRHPLPASVLCAFPAGEREVRYRGFHLYATDDPEDLGRVPWYQSRAVLPGKLRAAATVRVAAPDGSALVTERSGKWFVNGNSIHLEFSSVLANLLAPERPVFEAPAHAYVVTGPARSAVFAAAATDVSLRLPSGSRIAQWNERGRPVDPPSVRLEDGRLRGRLGRWHLVLVD